MAIEFKGRLWDRAASPEQYTCKGCDLLDLQGGIPCDHDDHPPCGLDYILRRPQPTTNDETRER